PNNPLDFSSGKNPRFPDVLGMHAHATPMVANLPLMQAWCVRVRMPETFEQDQRVLKSLGLVYANDTEPGIQRLRFYLPRRRGPVCPVPRDARAHSRPRHSARLEQCVDL